MLTRTGGRGGSLTLPSYVIHNASAQLKHQDWTLTAYVKNIFNEFAETGAAGTALNNAVFTDDNGGDVNSRSFFTYVAPPRSIGVRLSYKFGGGS